MRHLLKVGTESLHAGSPWAPGLRRSLYGPLPAPLLLGGLSSSSNRICIGFATLIPFSVCWPVPGSEVGGHVRQSLRRPLPSSLRAPSANCQFEGGGITTRPCNVHMPYTKAHPYTYTYKCAHTPMYASNIFEEIRLIEPFSFLESLLALMTHLCT